MEKNKFRLYEGMACGVSVSKYGLENGYLDYRALSRIVGDCILNNTLRDQTMEDWDIVAGEFDDCVFQDYIISERGYEFLEEFTDELVFYNDKLDIYVWSITHFGTGWDYVLTNIELIGDSEQKWHGFEMGKRDAEKFGGYLTDSNIYFEPSSAYDIVHFECKMSDEELHTAEQWIKKSLLVL